MAQVAGFWSHVCLGITLAIIIPVTGVGRSLPNCYCILTTEYRFCSLAGPFPLEKSENSNLEEARGRLQRMRQCLSHVAWE